MSPPAGTGSLLSTSRQSTGAYYQVANRLTGQVIGTGNHTNDANIGNGDVPDVATENATGSSTQLWHLVTKPDGAATLLNKSGGQRKPLSDRRCPADSADRPDRWIPGVEAELLRVLTVCCFIHQSR